MPNYHESKIYKIWSPNTDMVYIGSTTQSLSKRMGQHVMYYRYQPNKNIRLCRSVEIIAFGDAKIELIEKIDCTDRIELLRAEGKAILNTKNCVNKQVAGRTKKEWIHDNKEKIAEDNSVYYQNNKEKIAEQKAVWYQNNKEIAANRGKIYRERTREKRLVCGAVRLTCRCGSIVRTDNMTRHYRSKKHTEYLDNQNNITTN